MIAHIGIVIPARDEQDYIARCLESVRVASQAVPALVSVVVVADGCLDATASIARRSRGVTVVEIESSNVGTARAVGARKAIALGADWLANTDADSVVPPHWLSVQLSLAAAGADVMIGTVRPDFAELTDEQAGAWWATHSSGEANGHVHGANLGIRVSSYLGAGGYRALPEHEDVDLVRRLGRSHTIATAECEVITSGRQVGRTPGGYARYLREELPGLASLRRNLLE